MKDLQDLKNFDDVLHLRTFDNPAGDDYWNAQDAKSESPHTLNLEPQIRNHDPKS